MQLLIGRNPFKKVVSIAQGVVPKRSPKPILTHLLLEADAEGGLTISATDEELSFSGSTEAQVEESGRVVVSAKDLYDIVRNLPDHPIRLVSLPDEGLLEIKCDRIEFRLHALPADEFPALPQMNPETSYNFPVADLCQLIDRTIFAVSHEETRYYLGGVYLECNEGENLRAVATDGHRLALCEATAPPQFELAPGQILPRKLLGELRKMIDANSGEVKFGFQDKRVLFQYGPQTLISLLVEGSFPDYRQVVPKSPNMNCRVPRVELLDALRRISLLSPDKTGGVRFQLDDKQLTISSQHTGRGQAQQEVQVKEGGGTIEVGFNAHYFIDALQAIDTADVQLELTNHLSPCLLRPFHEPDEDGNVPTTDQVNVVMPMRL